jgi:chorismate lyase / 3-hydroxybenzoate synthase
MSTPLTQAGPPPPPLGIDYERASADVLLAQDDVLALIGFGAATMDDPRVLQPGLARLDSDAPVFEVWRGAPVVACGREGDLRWSRSDEYLYFAIELDEAEHGGIDAAAEQAYRTICAFVADSAMPHFLRLWNYLDAINLGDGDDERYRLFCSGRARGMDARMHASYPAATAIGRQDGVRVLQVYGLAARHAGTPVENPRQVSAWRYPRQYGPTAPTFARGMHTAATQLLISGTAAVVGHASRHHADLAAQVDETLANLRSLLGQVDQRRTDLGEGTLLKVYVRDPADAAFVASSLRGQLPALADLLVLSGDICRSELLVEVDGVHRVGD